MQRLDSSAVRGGELSGKILKPTAISAVCPYCNHKVIFSLHSYSQPGPQNSISAAGICPSCKDKAGFWSLNPSGGSSFDAAEIYMSPPPKNYFSNPDDLESIPAPLKKALLSTIDCYNAGIYSAATVSGRRTLEGIFKYLLPEDKRKKPLHQLIEAAMHEQDLSQPLKTLSHAIRTGGNLGAHFDEKHEPDEIIARQMVELLSYLISYLYVLPSQISQLESDLGKTTVR